MLQLSIQEALEREDEAREHSVYLYRDGDAILYVGRSIHPFQRLQEHLGGDFYTGYPDAIGTVILDNRPESFTWTVEIHTIKELAPEAYTQAGEFMRQAITDDIERDMIERYRPYLNGQCKRDRTPLPSRYRKGKIANAGVKLD